MAITRAALAVDVGGTKIAVARAEATYVGGVPVKYTLDKTRVFSTQEHANIASVVAGCLADVDFGAVHGVGIGVAGPVEGGRASLTNVGWVIDEAEISSKLGRLPVRVMNDLIAHAYGITVAPESACSTLHKGRVRSGNIAVIAIGTGLGQSVLFWDGQRYVPSPSEGGHASFSPRDDEEIALLQFLRRKYGATWGGHVSWERVVSGLFGFRSIYEYVLAEGGYPPEPDLARALDAGQDAGPVITVNAKGGSKIADHTLRLFARLLASEAGNFALKALATGGVYFGGGVLPHIKPWLGEAFTHSFADKGRFSDFLRQIPLRLIEDPGNALRGAAHGVLQKL